MSEHYSLGDHMRALGAQARGRQGRLALIYLALVTIAVLAAFSTAVGLPVAVIVVIGSAVASFLLSYVGARRSRQR